MKKYLQLFSPKKYYHLAKECIHLLRGNNNILNAIQVKLDQFNQPKEERYIELNKTYFKVKNHWFWDEYDWQGWEPQTYKTFFKFITPQTTYIDIGAWVGTTIFFAAEIGAKKLYAVEANPLSFELVKQNCLLNKLTENTKLDNLCITDKDNEKISFGGKNGPNTSSASSIRGNDWEVNSNTLISYLKENQILENELFIKIDIEGAEELLIEDIDRLKDKSELTIYLSIHPTFFTNKEKACRELLNVCYKYKNVLNSSLIPLHAKELEKMILSDDEKPSWGTSFGNFFEITLTNKDIALLISH